MKMDKKQLRDLISLTLKKIDLHSESAVELLLGTAAQESRLGEYIRQLRNGPALGIFQMEPDTFKDILDRYLLRKPELFEKIKAVSGIDCYKVEYLEWNLVFAICMSRVFYLRIPEAIPADLTDQAAYWKKYYNTHLGKGTVQEYIDNYKLYVQ